MLSEVTFPLRTVVIFSPSTDPAANEAQQIRVCDRYMAKFSKEAWEHRMLEMYERGVPVQEICDAAPCAPATLYTALKRAGLRPRNRRAA